MIKRKKEIKNILVEGSYFHDDKLFCDVLVKGYYFNEG